VSPAASAVYAFGSVPAGPFCPITRRMPAWHHHADPQV